MHNKNWEKENDGKESTYLIRIYLFWKFPCRAILSRSSFIQTSIFRKNFFLFFLSFSNMIYFFQQLLFQTSQFFFVNFQITQKYFLKKTNKTLVFSIFFLYLLFKVKHHPTSRKKTEWETIFLYFFFRNWKHIFLFWQESNFLNFNEVIKFIDTKTGKHFF